MESQTIRSKAAITQATAVQTPLERFYRWEREQANKVYLRQPIQGKYTDYTWGEVGKQARKMANYLHSLKLPPHSNIGLVSKNCAHWIIADLAIMMAGHVPVPFYPSLIASQLDQVMTHSGCKVLFIGKLETWKGMKEGIPEGVHTIAFPHYPGNDSIKADVHWYDIMVKNEPMTENYIPDLQDLYTITYTSGTTGNPKGVMTTFYAASVGTDKNIKYMDMEGKENRFFSYLPLCHIAERAFVEGGSFTTGAVVYFAESLETFAQNLRDAQPTHFLAVPRIWTKFQMGILSKVPQKKLDRLLKIPILSTMVKNKIRKGLGLNKVRVAITAAAPMPAALLDWYKKLGLNIREAYGMTENGGACTVMPADKIKIGTVGKPYDYVQVKIDPQSKEILMKSDLLMTGYYREPYMTAEVLQNGWLHTGDMGEFDEEGYLKLTGRVKDLFKTAKGEYVVPGPIEWKFAINQDIEQICVVGTGLPQPIALIVLSDLAKAKPIEEIKKHLAEQIPHINRELVNYMQIKKVVIVREAWTTENGILTPTLKVKRNVLEAHYQSKIETWYEMADMVIEEGQ